MVSYELQPTERGWLVLRDDKAMALCLSVGRARELARLLSARGLKHGEESTFIDVDG